MSCRIFEFKMSGRISETLNRGSWYSAEDLSLDFKTSSQGRFKYRFNKNKQIPITHVLYCENNSRCPAVSLQLLYILHSVWVCIGVAKKRRRETTIAGIKLIIQVMQLQWVDCFCFRKCHCCPTHKMLLLAGFPVKEMLQKSKRYVGTAPAT